MEFRLPELGEGVHEAELVEWLVRAGQTVRRGDALAEVLTDKASIALPAPFAGTVDALLAQPGETIAVGQLLLRYSALDGALRPVTSAMPAPAMGPVVQPGARWAAASAWRAHAGGDGAARPHLAAAPAVREMARSLGIDLNDVPGSGPEGRVLIGDLGAYARACHPSSPQRATRAMGTDCGTPGQRIPLQGLRRSIAEHMVASKRAIPHYSYIDECDVSSMVALRNELRRPLYARGVKLTSLPFYVKAVVEALQQVPIINASLDEQAGEIVLHNRYHIGIATATARGLMVPVIHDADSQNLAEIAAEIERLIRAAQAGAIARRDLCGSTFTISSVGNFGGLVSTPIIHHPEVGIVAIGKVFRRPTYDASGAIVPAHIAYLSFSFDHRVIDGSVGAMFGNAVIQRLQHPQELAAGVLSS